MRCAYIESVDNILKYCLVVKGKTVTVRLLGRMTTEEIFVKLTMSRVCINVDEKKPMERQR